MRLTLARLGCSTLRFSASLHHASPRVADHTHLGSVDDPRRKNSIDLCIRVMTGTITTYTSSAVDGESNDIVHCACYALLRPSAGHI